MCQKNTKLKILNNSLRYYSKLSTLTKRKKMLSFPKKDLSKYSSTSLTSGCKGKSYMHEKIINRAKEFIIKAS